MAKGLLPDTHPQCASAARSLVLKESDCVFLIGARLNWLLSHGQGPGWGEKGAKSFVQIDIEPTEMDSNQKISAPTTGPSTHRTSSVSRPGQNVSMSTLAGRGTRAATPVTMVGDATSKPSGVSAGCTLARRSSDVPRMEKASVATT